MGNLKDKSAELPEEAFKAATEALWNLAHHLPGGLDSLANLPAPLLLLAFTPGVVAHRGRKLEDSYFEVDPVVADYLAGMAQIDPDAAEIVEAICAMNVHSGASLPPGLRTYAADIIRRKPRAVKRRGAPPSADFGQKYLLYVLVHQIADRFNLNITHGDDKPGGSACFVVAEAADAVGLDVTYLNLRDWCTHRKHKAFRERADAISSYIAVHEPGFRGDPHMVSPFGPIGELGRMRQKAE